MTERDSATGELPSTDRRPLDIIDFLPDATFAIDMEGRVIAWNRAIAEITGVPRDEIIGQGDYAYAIPWYGERRPILIDLVRGENAAWESRYDFVERRGGTLFAEVFAPHLRGGRGLSVWCAAGPLLDEHGTQVGAIETIRDITDRKEAERALRESEERFRALYADLPSMLFTVDPGGTVLSVNEYGAAHLGYAVGDLIGGSVLRVFPPELHTEAAAHVAECVLNPGQAFTWELEKIRRDGSRLFVREVARAVPGPHGETTVLIACDDVTEHRRIEMRDRAQEAVSRVLATAPTLSAAAPDLLGSLCATLGWDVGQIWVAEPDSGDLRMAAELRVRSVDLASAPAGAPDAVGARWQELPGDVLRSGEPRWVSCAPAAPSQQGRGSADDLRTGVGVPIVAGGGELGVFVLYSRDERPPDEDALKLLSAVGNQVGQFIDRERSIDALRRSERFLASIVENIPDLITVKDGRSQRFLSLNRGGERLIGIPREEYVGKRDEDVAPPDEAARHLAEDRQVLETGRPLDVEETIRSRSGGPLIVHTKKVPITDASGTPEHVLIIAEDITASRQAERELAGAHRRLLDIIDFLPDAVFVIDADKRVIAWNRAVEEMTGTRKDEIIGQGDYAYAIPWYGERRPILIDLLDHDDPELASRYDSLRRVGNTLFAEVFVPRLRGGRGAYLAGAAAPLLDSEGRKVGAIESMRDVTDSKRAEEALRQSEERYRHIIEAITDYVYTVRVEGGRAVSTEHGPGCVAVTGYAPHEFVEDPELWIRMVVPEDRAAVTEQARLVLSGERSDMIEHRIVRKDGATRWVRNTPVPQYGPDGVLVAYDGLIQDITERRVLQEELLHVQKMESIGRLAGGVAHDFNNLLTTIIGNAELAKSYLLPNHPARASIEEITEAGERAASLTRQLLAFARKQIVAPERINLSVLVSDSLKMLRRLLGEDLEVVTDLDPDLGTVEADPGQIQQLLINLTVNARDAMPNGGRLAIETANETVTEAYTALHPEVTPGAYVSLTVSDTGVGMPESIRAHLFEPFYTTKEPGKGTGLGLAMCHGIVSQNGGHIWAYSEAGHGTTFKILLPRIDGPAGTPAELADPVPVPRGSETILVVEDEEAIRRLATSGLRALGYTVLEAPDGSRAIDVAAKVPGGIHLLVTDMVMPGMSGAELAERIRTICPGARYILTSGYTRAVTVPRLEGVPEAAFLAKPFTLERLARLVREVLDEPPGRTSSSDDEQPAPGSPEIRPQ